MLYGEMAKGSSEGPERLEDQWDYSLRLAHELLVEVREPS